MTDEIWKPVHGYEEKYEVSNLGRVRSLYFVNKTTNKKLETPRILKPTPTKPWGHLYVSLSKDGIIKRYFVHRLVLVAFYGPQPQTMECSHLDGNPKNNHINNLEWQTHKQNCALRTNHGTQLKGSKNPGSKLNESQVFGIKILLLKGVPPKEIAKTFNVSTSLVNQIKTRKIWLHV